MINWLILLCYIIAAFLVMFILDAIWERLQCRACDKISLRVLRHAYCPSCKVEVESDWDAWMTEIRKGEGQCQ